MKAILLALGLSACVFPGTVFGTPIMYTGSGILNFNGLSVYVTGSPSTGCVNFYNSTEGSCGVNANFTVQAPADTSVFPAPTTGTGTVADIPMNTTTESDFITAGSVDFDLLGFMPTGTNLCAPTTSYPYACAVSGSPFVYTLSSANDITVTFTVSLCGYTGSPGLNCSTGTLYSGQFTAPFDGTYSSLTDLLNTEQASGITDSITAQLIPAAVPEPGASFLLGAGLICVGLISRRKRAES